MSERTDRTSWAADVAWAGLLALLVTAPVVASRGYTLRGDMVFVPDQPWKPSWLGLDGGVPRAVPSDALTWLAGTVLPGDVVQKLVLLLTLLLAGVGTARLVRTLVGDTWLLTAAPVSLFVWNPYVYERLSIGHWALLCGYATLPWVVLTAAGRRPLLTVVPVAVAAWTSPTGGVLAAVTALAVLVVSRAAGRGSRIVSAVLVAAVQLPWVLPGLLAPAVSGDEGRTGVEAFAARADTPWGSLGSLLSFGGSWKAVVDAPGRDVWLLSGVALVLTLAGLAGLVALARRTGGVAIVLGVLALVGLVLAWLPTTSWGLDLMAGLGSLPGGGLLRDSQKWVAPLVLAAAVGLAEATHRWLPHGSGRTYGAAVLALLPLAVMPVLAWGLAGTLHTVDYPDEWDQVRDVMDRAGAQDERTVVLPFSVYRRYPWNEQTAVLDPAPRFFPGDVVVDDSLPVPGRVVPGESVVAERVRAAAGDPDTLARVLADEGIRFVLVENTAPGGQDVAVPAGEVVHDGPELTLVDLGSGDPPRTLGSAGRAVVIAGDLLAVAALLVGIALGRRRMHV